MKASLKVRRFRVTTQPKSNRPGTWDSTIVTVLDGDTEVGAYERNYPRFAEETFEPFELDGRWYALYSRDYTCTRVMTLPDCKDIGGEEPQAHGFCPVELFVPRYRVVTTTKAGDPTYRYESWLFEADAESFRELDANKNAGFAGHVGPWRTLDVAFVAGCIWGDDSSWKLQAFDLSRVTAGTIERSDRFGFVELAAMPLSEAVRCHCTSQTPLRVRIVRQEDRDLRSGAHVDPYE